MSISPKILNRNKDKYTVFHMNINNGTDENIKGYISYKITKPNGKEELIDFNRIEEIKAHTEINLYDKYYIDEKSELGRYYVDGRFFWNNNNILSDTNKNDFFDVEDLWES